MKSIIWLFALLFFPVATLRLAENIKSKDIWKKSIAIRLYQETNIDVYEDIIKNIAKGKKSQILANIKEKFQTQAESNVPVVIEEWRTSVKDIPAQLALLNKIVKIIKETAVDTITVGLKYVGRTWRSCVDNAIRIACPVIGFGGYHWGDTTFGSIFEGVRSLSSGLLKAATFGIIDLDLTWKILDGEVEARVTHKKCAAQSFHEQAFRWRL